MGGGMRCGFHLEQRTHKNQQYKQTNTQRKKVKDKGLTGIKRIRKLLIYIMYLFSVGAYK